MGWFKNVFKSLSDAGGEISQSEATDAEVKAFLAKAGVSSSTVNDLEDSLKERKGLMKRLKSDTKGKEENDSILPKKEIKTKENVEKELER